MSHVLKLDGILSQLYKNNVELFTAWKAVRRQEQDLPSEGQPTPPPPPDSGT